MKLYGLSPQQHSALVMLLWLPAVSPLGAEEPTGSGCGQACPVAPTDCSELII